MCGMPSAVREARGLPVRRPGAGRRSSRCPDPVVQRVEAALGELARPPRRAGRRGRATRRPGPPRPGAGRAGAAPRAWPARRRARGPGGRARPRPAVGPGRIVQLISRRLTTSPVSRIAGRRSRPERTGSRSSSRPGATGPDRRDRGAALAAEREDAVAVPRRDVLERVVGRVLDPRALDPRVEPGEIDELRALLVGALRDRPDEPLLARTPRSARRPVPAGGWPRSRRRARRSVRELHRPWHGERSWCEDAAVPPRYRHVLVAFDGSPEAELALAHAVAIAQAYRASSRSSPSFRRRRCCPGRRRAGCRASTSRAGGARPAPARGGRQGAGRPLADHAAARRRPGARAPARGARGRPRRDRDGLARPRAGDRGACSARSPTT